MTKNDVEKKKLLNDYGPLFEVHTQQYHNMMSLQLALFLWMNWKYYMNIAVFLMSTNDFCGASKYYKCEITFIFNTHIHILQLTIFLIRKNTIFSVIFKYSKTIIKYWNVVIFLQQKKFWRLLQFKIIIIQCK